MDFRQLRHTLRSKLGASEDREGHHIYYCLSIGDRDHRVGKVSHSARGSDKVEDYVIWDTGRRLRLDKKEFLQLVDCTINRDDHAKLWQERAS